MVTKLPRIILASSSPRRQELLRKIGVEFEVVTPQVDESALSGEKPADLVQRLSLAKAQSAVKARGRGIVLGADTVVVLGGVMLGKPADAAEARTMLRRLSGRTHTVYSAFALVHAETGQTIRSCETAEVTFRHLEDHEIAAYVATGSTLDKAGAYGIQDEHASTFIEKISGDADTVAGLPLARVQQALEQMARRSP